MKTDSPFLRKNINGRQLNHDINLVQFILILKHFNVYAGSSEQNHKEREKVLRLTKTKKNDPKKVYTCNSALTNLQ